MAENRTIFKTRTYDFLISYNELKQHQKSKCAYTKVYTRDLLAPGVSGFCCIDLIFIDQQSR